MNRGLAGSLACQVTMVASPAFAAGARDRR
jgi:hypothetical protein